MVADVYHLGRTHAGLLEGIAEDPRVRLFEPDAGGRRDEVEVTDQLEGVQQLRQRPDPVAHRSNDQVPRAETVQGGGHLREDVPVAGHEEQLGEAPEEGIRQWTDAQPFYRQPVDLDRALKARLLVRLEATLHPPSAVVVGLPQRDPQRLDVNFDAVLGEGHGVDLLPRRAGAHDRVADVQEDGAQGPKAGRGGRPRLARVSLRGRPLTAGTDHGRRVAV